jgi:hypothetical protein
MISFDARQKFRQRIQNIENADEVIDALNEFVERFKLISANVSSNQYETVYEYIPKSGETTIITYTILGRESDSKQAGFKRTAMFFKQGQLVSQVDVQQTDFTFRQDSQFNARLLVHEGVVKLQVKGISNSFTQWRGSIEIEKIEG